MVYPKDTIAAIATPIGIAGIGIIRISGPGAQAIARKIFRPKRPISSFESFRLYLGHIIDPKENLPIDEVLLSAMYAPRSYTCEDVIEINSHSGYALLSNILDIVLQAGARLAKPGEFTLRAFLNGRIDLTQAEAIVDLINATSDKSVRLAINQLGGGFTQRIEVIRSALIETLAQVEAAIDFPDQGFAMATTASMVDHINNAILGPTRELIAGYAQRKLWYEGFSVVIAGRVNVGKSSIFNRLLEEERALVTPIPGTTRDALEATVIINGLPLRLIDTAGVRKMTGTIEQKGAQLTKAQLSRADLVLLVVDQSRPLHHYDTDLLQEAQKAAVIVVVNKVDLPAKMSQDKIGATFKKPPRVRVSALTGEGFKGLKEVVLETIIKKTKGAPFTALIPSLRQRNILEKAGSCLEKAMYNLSRGLPLELAAADLSWAKDALDEITGHKTSEEVLESIFNNFCVGK
jgi:tRNA modification GTPase